MSDPGTSTGRFWICPNCKKHVPARGSACVCGYERQAAHIVREIQRSVATANPREASSPLWAIGFGLACAGLVVYGAYAYLQPAPESAPFPRRVVTIAQPPPQILMVERTAAPTTPEAGVTQAPEPATVVEAVITNVTQPAPELVATAEPPAVPNHEVRRQLSGEEFEREMIILEKKADAAEVAWERYASGCRKNVEAIGSFAGFADRDWIAIAGVTHVRAEWTNDCDLAGAAFALIAQVKDGMCVAETRARQGGVFPGTRRALRHKYRLDWDGWDRTCIG